MTRKFAGIDVSPPRMSEMCLNLYLVGNSVFVTQMDRTVLTSCGD